MEQELRGLIAQRSVDCWVGRAGTATPKQKWLRKFAQAVKWKAAVL